MDLATRTGRGHTVPGINHDRPSGFGFMTVHEGSLGVVSGHLAEAGP